MKPRPSSSPPPPTSIIEVEEDRWKDPEQGTGRPPLFPKILFPFSPDKLSSPSIDPSVHPSPHERSDFFFGNQLAGSTHHAVPFDASRGQRSWIAPPAVPNPNPPVSSLRIEGVSFPFPSFPNWRPGTRSFGVRRKRVDRFRAIAPESRLVRGER